MPEGRAPVPEPSVNSSTADILPGHPLSSCPLYENPALFDLVHSGYRGDVDWYRQAVGTTPALVIELGCGMVQGYFIARPGKRFPEVTWTARGAT